MAKKRRNPKTFADPQLTQEGSASGSGSGVADTGQTSAPALVPATPAAPAEAPAPSAATVKAATKVAEDPGVMSALDRVLTHIERDGEVFAGALADIALIRSTFRH